MNLRTRHLRRPDQFHMDYGHWLAKGLVFAGLGCAPHGTTYYRDSSPQGNAGALTNFADPNPPTKAWQYAPELGRMGIAFDGSDDEILCPPGLARFEYTQPFSACCWYYSVGVTTSQVLMGSLGGSPSPAGWEIAAYDGGFQSDGLTSYLYNSGDHFCQVTATNQSLLSQSAWYHLAITCTGTGLATGTKLYCNGYPIAMTTKRDTLGSNTIIGSAPIRIGRRAGALFPTNGYVVDPIVAARVLTAPEVALLAAPRWSVMMDGLIVPDRRRVTFAPLALNRRRRVLLAGVPQ